MSALCLKSGINPNDFDDYLRQVNESRQNAEAIRAKIVESEYFMKNQLILLRSP